MQGKQILTITVLSKHKQIITYSAGGTSIFGSPTSIIGLNIFFTGGSGAASTINTRSHIFVPPFSSGMGNHGLFGSMYAGT